MTITINPAFAAAPSKMWLAVLQCLGASTLKQLLGPCMRDTLPHLVGETMVGGLDVSSIMYT